MLKVNLVENELRRRFADGPGVVAEPPDWQAKVMRAVRVAAARGATERYLFSPRQERLIWRWAWGSLAASVLVVGCYFGIFHDRLDDLPYRPDMTLAVVDWPENWME